MLNNYVYLTYSFKSNTMQHVFIIYNSLRLFNLEKSDFTCGLCETAIRGRGRQFDRIDSFSGEVKLPLLLTTEKSSYFSD